MSILGFFTENEFFLQISQYSFILVIPLLTGHIASAICGSLGMIPGILTGYMAYTLGIGIFGAILAGFAIGYITEFMKKIRVPIQFSSMLYILVIPLTSTLVVGGLLYYLVDKPVTYFLNNLEFLLSMLNDKNIIILSFVLGGMIGSDMGGPINKVAYLFGVSSLNKGAGTIMGPIAVAICIPPLALGFAQYIIPDRFSSIEREAGIIAIILGILGITEGAIPYLTNDLKILPATILGSAIGAAIASILKVSSFVPHGGIILLPLINGKLGFIISIVVGVVATIFFLYFLKGKVEKEEL